MIAGVYISNRNIIVLLLNIYPIIMEEPISS